MTSPEPSTPLAIACTLDGAAMSDRLAEIAALGSDALVDRQVRPGLATLRFAAREGVRERVDAIVAAESTCCAFLRFDVSEEPGAIVVRVATPEDAQVLLEEFADSFAPAPTAA